MASITARFLAPSTNLESLLSPYGLPSADRAGDVTMRLVDDEPRWSLRRDRRQRSLLRNPREVATAAVVGVLSGTLLYGVAMNITEATQPAGAQEPVAAHAAP
jgi:hypothetical protein